MDRDIRARVMISVLITIAGIMSVFHAYNINLGQMDAVTRPASVVVFLIIAALGGMYVLNKRANMTDERSEHISSLAGMYSFRGNLYLMMGFMAYEMSFGIKAGVTDIIPFIMFGIIAVYGAIYIVLSAYYS